MNKKNNLLISGCIFASYFILILNVSAYGPVGENGFNVNIINDTILIRGYTVVANPNGGISQALSDTLFINKVTSSIGSGITCVNFNYTNGNESTLIPTNCTYYSNYNYDVSFLGQNFSNQSTLQFVDTVTQGKYETCMNDKRNIEAKYQIIAEQSTACNKTNNDYMNCNSQLAVCNSKNDGLNKDIETINQEKTETKNNGWWFFIAGAIVGFVGTMYYVGKWGGSKPKNYEEDFQRSAAK